ncbi:MAG: hypothetical protein JKY83_07565 [Rhizobiaceae bacterium]|nr:hypothetical protein [Rhizobiaceae bacterium]
MPKPLNAFLWIFCAIIAFGVLVGLLNLWNPQAVHIPFGPNGESAEGLDGMIASVLSSGVLGLIFGLLAALITWVFKAGVNKANKRN